MLEWVIGCCRRPAYDWWDSQGDRLSSSSCIGLVGYSQVLWLIAGSRGERSGQKLNDQCRDIQHSTTPKYPLPVV